MLSNLWQDAIWRALLGGSAFVILSAIGLYWAGTKTQKNGRLYALLHTAAVASFAFAGLLTGVFSPAHLAIKKPDLVADLYTAGLIAAGAFVWLMALLYPYRRALRSQNPPPRTPLTRLSLSVLQDEASLAIARAAIAPLAGLYAALWLSPLITLLLTLTDPRTHRQLAEPGERRLVLLRWVLDWSSALTIFWVGSVWLSLAVRLVVRAAFELALRIPTPTRAAFTALDDKRENDQQGKQASGQNADAL